MRAAAAAGLTYFALVFLLGAMVGTARTHVLEPHVGALAATMLELPLMLAAAALLAGSLAELFRVPSTVADRLLMGTLAFASLMLAELAMDMAANGATALEHFRDYRTPANFLGLGGQIGFALLPLLVLLNGSKRAAR
jgi:hypothetical protein